MADDRSPVQHTIALRRVDPDTNVARFYVLTLERDLFGNFAVTRQWSRAGTAGRVITKPFGTEVEAAEAMAVYAAAKRRRGYRDL
jgi:predicted DNA-binding WGR domain protein